MYLDPKSAALYTNKAACLTRLKRYKESLECCKISRQLDPSWIKTYFREGEAYYALEEYAEAATSFFEGYKLDTTNKVFE